MKKSFIFDKADFLMTSATPPEEKDYVLLNVRELGRKESVLKIIDRNSNPVTFSIVNAIEEVIESGLKENRFLPYENKFIKLKL